MAQGAPHSPLNPSPFPTQAQYTSLGFITCFKYKIAYAFPIKSDKFRDRVTVWYRCNNSGPPVVFVHFRQDLSDEEIHDESLHASIREHLEANGASFPFR
jgi:hypothetical protein